MYVLKSMLVNSSVVWLVVLLGTEFVSLRHCSSQIAVDIRLLIQEQILF